MKRKTMIWLSVSACTLIAAIALAANYDTVFKGRVMVLDGYDRPTAGTATGQGDLYVEDAIECDGTLTVGGAFGLAGDLTLAGGAGALTFSDSASSVLLPDNDTTALLLGSTGALNLMTFDTANGTETVDINGTTAQTAFSVTTGTATFSEDVTFSGGAGAFTCSGSDSSFLLTDNDTTSLVFGSTGLLNLLTLDTGNNTETVVVTGTTAVTAFHVDTGTALIDEDLSIGGGAGALTLTDSASSFVLPDNDATALLVGSTGMLNLLTIDTQDNLETVEINGTAAATSLYVNTGTVLLDEDLTCGGGAGALTFTDSASSMLLPDNDSTAFDVGATGATAMLRYDTTNGAERFVMRSAIGVSPAVFDTFAEGADKGLSYLKFGGTVFGTAAGDINQAYTTDGNVFDFFAMSTAATQDTAPVMTAVGLNIAGDQHDNDGLEMFGGMTGASGRPFVVGTDPAFKFCAYVKIQDGNGTDDFHIGFREAEPPNVTFDNYTDLASIGIVTVANPALLQLETIIGDAATVTTDTTDTWADATAKKFCVLVDAAGVVTYTNDGAAPTQTAAYTFADGLLVIPFIHFLQANAAQTGTLEILEWEVAYQ